MNSLREQVKIKFEKPLFTRTIYGNAFANRKGSEEVGALDNEGKHSYRAAKPIGDLEKIKDVPLKFAGISSNGLNFAGHGDKRLPTPNKITYETLFSSNGRFYDQTAYGE